MLAPTVVGPRAELSQIALGRIAATAGFVLPRVMPIVPAPSKVIRYFKLAKGAMLGAPDARRAPGADYQRNNLSIEDDSATVEGKGLEGLIPDEQAAEYAGVLSLEQSRTDQKTMEILRREDKELFDLVFSRTTFPVAATSGHDCSVAFDTHATATPVDDILRAVLAIRGNIGDFRAQGLQVCGLCSFYTRRHLALCTQVRSGLGGVYTRPEFAAADIPDAMLAAALNLDEIIVSGDAYMSAGTQASPTVTNLADDDYMLIFVRTNPNAPELAGLGVTFVWDGFGGELSVRTYREDKISSGVVQVNRSSVLEIIQSGAGYLIGNTKA